MLTKVAEWRTSPGGGDLLGEEIALGEAALQLRKVRVLDDGVLKLGVRLRVLLREAALNLQQARGIGRRVSNTQPSLLVCPPRYSKHRLTCFIPLFLSATRMESYRLQIKSLKQPIGHVVLCSA